MNNMTEFEKKWHFEKIDNGIKITGYKGSNTEETIPEFIVDELNSKNLNILSLGSTPTTNFKPLVKLDIIKANIECIDDNTFENCKNLKYIRLPDTVKDLGENTFLNCTNLIGINIPKSVTKLKSGIFKNCTSLSGLGDLSNIKEIDFSAMINCHTDRLFKKDDLTFKVNQNELTLIQYSGQAETLIIPESYCNYNVTNILNSAFCIVTKEHGLTYHNKSNFKEIVIPKTVNYVSKDIFYHATELTKITFLNDNIQTNNGKINTVIPNLNEINMSAWNIFNDELLNKLAFKKLDNWDNIDIKEQQEFISFINQRHIIKNDIMCSNNTNAILILLDNLIFNLNEISLYLSHSIEENNLKITSILLEYQNSNFSKEYIEQTKKHQELIEIGLETQTYDEFQKDWICTKVNNEITILGYKGTKPSATIPDYLSDGCKITKISSERHDSYFPLKSIIIEAEITTIEQNTFLNSTELEEIILPETLTDLGSQAFTNCYKLNNINLPKSLINIQDCFSNCSNLTEITIPENVEYLSPYTFSGCSRLKKVEILAQLKSIEERTFNDCFVLEEIYLPNSIIEIKQKAFYVCFQLTEITIPASVEVIKASAFEFCNHLNKVNFLGKTPIIEENAFASTTISKEFKEKGYI